MLSLFQYGVRLFLEGKLFRDLRYFYSRLAIGIAVTVVVMLALSFVIKSLILLALIGGVVGGALAPYLFADVRYR